MLAVPQYIAAARIQSHDVTHRQIVEEDYFRDTPLTGHVRYMSYRAALAFAAANAEWIAWRYEGRADNTTLLRFIEAVWAGVIDVAYVNRGTIFFEPAPQDPAASALMQTGRLLSSVFWGVRNLSRGCTREASYVAVLARHVLVDKEPFAQWVKVVVSRIAPLYPGAEAPNRLGSPVPREAFDPSYDFKPEQTPDLLHAFLARLDPAQNSFLRTPEEMVQTGFKGKPYSL